jgi:hypothetical protein
MVMAVQLASEEPEGGPWRAVPLTVVVMGLLQLVRADNLIHVTRPGDIR